MSGTIDQTATWWAKAHADDGGVLVAYFSMEFGVDTRLAIYSGGLGVLAGDHLKAASELGVPLVAVGLFYRGGYFVQSVSGEGRQTEHYQELDPEELGLVREAVDVEVDLGGELVNVAPCAAAAAIGNVIERGAATLARRRSRISRDRGPGISVFSSITRVVAIAARA